MIGRVLIVLTSLAMASPAAAQVVQLRSGEHDTFSRLTIEMPSRLKWMIDPGDKTATIRFDAKDLQVDTSVVFDKIPRDRISAVTWSGTTKALQLSFGCDCEVNGFWHGASLLVLDVTERPARTADVDPTLEQPKINPGLELQARPSSRAAKLTQTELFGPRIAKADQAAASVRQDPPSTPLDDARDQLLQQLARAATQGLIEPRRRSVSDQLIERDPPDTSASSSEVVQEAPTNIGRPQINLKAESSIDRDFLDANLANARGGGTNGCLSLSQIDVGSWGSDAPFGHQISELRLELTGEFDEVNPDVARKLARLYLYFGFGAEAREMLALTPSTSLESAVLLQLAEIAEHGYAKDPFYLANQMDCTSPAALWSAMSYEELPRDLPIDTDAILRAFNALPQHLRTHYGPILSRRFLNAGQDDIAKKLLRILDRPDTLPTPQAEMAKAQADLKAGQTQRADARLKQVVESNAEPSAEALVKMINDRVDRDQRVSFEQAQLAGAYAFEKQNDPIGAELSAAHIRALASAGSFDMAYETLSDHGDVLRPDQMPALHSDMVRLLVDYANDMTFLHHMFSGRVNPGVSLDPFAANKAADRLIQLGFPRPAADFITQDAPRSSSAFRERRLLRAEMALKMNRPRQAIVELLDLNGTDANLLRGRALSEVGNHAAAYHLFVSSEKPEKARQEAWLKGDWQRAADPEEPAYAALADMLATNENNTEGAPLESPAILASNRDLINASMATRETLSALLAANPVPQETAANP